jgi:5,10-methylenetetrahydromethanopterin reductase
VGYKPAFWFTAWRREFNATLPKLAVESAIRAEREGWSGMWVIDSQNLAGDPYASLALAARETESLEMGPGVTNPYTRHPAVTASAIATIQEISHGRAALGIGRGDSSLGFLGLAPAPLDLFDRYLRAVQDYLAGKTVPFDLRSARAYGMRPFAEAGIGTAPTGSRIQWLDDSMMKVPVDVAATGPKAIALGAVVGDRLSLSVGADPKRIAWAIDVAREARAQSQLDQSGLSIGVFVNLVVTDDVSLGNELIAPSLTGFARFSAMHGKPAGPLSQTQRAAMEAIRDNYTMGEHGKAGSSQMSVVTPEFIKEFGIVGSAEHCIARLRAIVSLGVERLTIIGPSSAKHAAAVARSHQRFVEEVMPAFQ